MFGCFIGDNKSSLIESQRPAVGWLCVFWLFEIPFAYILAYHFNFGPNGVFWAITIAFSLLAVVSAIVFKLGRWKLKKV